MKNLKLLCSLLALCTWVGGVAQPGTLDPGFMMTGKVVTTQIQQANAVAIQPDGKIIAAGTAELYKDIPPMPNANFALARYNTKGDLDQAFGEWGRTYTDFFSRNDAIQALALQPDGKIVAAGFAMNGGAKTFAVARYLPTGQLDISFGYLGKQVLPFYQLNDAFSNFTNQEESMVFGLALQPDGKMVLAGITRSSYMQDFDIGLMRLLRDGSPDPTFGHKGMVVTDLRLNADDYAHAVGLQPNGQIILAGAIDEIGMRDIALVRFNSNGTLDYSFGEAGIVRTDFANTQETAYAMAFQTDGKFVVAGTLVKDHEQDIILLRYLPNGVLDNSFGHAGKVRADMGGLEDCRAVVVQTDGRIIAAGSKMDGNERDFAIIRFETNGDIDFDYGFDDPQGPDYGVLTHFLGYDQVLCAAIQADGKAVIAGLTERPTGGKHLAIARYLPGKTLRIQEAEPFRSIRLYPNPSIGSCVLEYSLVEPQNVSINVYNQTGKLVQTVLQPTHQIAGDYNVSVMWNTSMPSGMYLLVLDNGNHQSTIWARVE